MFVNFYLPSINPILYSPPKTGLQVSHVMLKIPNTSSSCLLPDSACRPYRMGSPRKTSSGTCHRKPYDLFGGFNVAKAVKTYDNEVSSFAEEDITVDFDCTVDEDEGAPWEGAIVYRRSSSITHLENCTTLERLGLGKLSSELSRSRASAMGLRLTKAVKDYLDGTPVLISVDVIRKEQKLRLDGIIKTVITLSCNRCGAPALESIFSNFSVLLTEEPIQEPEFVNLGTTYGDDELRTFGGTDEDEEDEPEASIDLDDMIYFPPEQKEIDISKHIRDMIHLEVSVYALCDPKCKGLCLRCATNLNTSVCNCSEEDVDSMSYGPLGKLRKQMQQK